MTRTTRMTRTTQALLVLTLLVALFGGPLLLDYPPAVAAPSTPPMKIACLKAKSATANTNLVTSFAVGDRYPVEGLVVEIQVSGTATILNVVVSDDAGSTWTKLPLNGSTGNLTLGKLHTFSTVIADTDQDGDDLIYNIQVDADTTIDFATLHRARVGAP